MTKFKISRTVKVYEHCEIEAEDFDSALDLALNDDNSLDWKSSQLGDDWDITAVCSLDENGEDVEDRDVDEKGRFE